jgi:hypothetical protein
MAGALESYANSPNAQPANSLANLRSMGYCRSVNPSSSAAIMLLGLKRRLGSGRCSHQKRNCQLLVCRKVWPGRPEWQFPQCLQMVPGEKRRVNRGRAPSTRSRRGWASPSKSNLTCRERDTGVFHTQERQVVCRVSESDQRREHHRHLFRPNNTGEPRAAELMSAWCFPLASRFPSSDRVPTPKFTPVVRAGGRRPASL